MTGIDASTKLQQDTIKSLPQYADPSKAPEEIRVPVHVCPGNENVMYCGAHVNFRQRSIWSVTPALPMQ